MYPGASANGVEQARKRRSEPAGKFRDRLDRWIPQPLLNACDVGPIEPRAFGQAFLRLGLSLPQLPHTRTALACACRWTILLGEVRRGR